jgi:hypothetical protein
MGSRVLKFLRSFSFNLKKRMLLYLSFLEMVSFTSANYRSTALSFNVRVSIYCLLLLSFIFLAFYSCLYFYFKDLYYYSIPESGYGFCLSYRVGLALTTLLSSSVICYRRTFRFFSNYYSFFLDYIDFFLR